MPANPSSPHLSRRDFIKAVTASIGSLIGMGVGLPAMGYLLSPALQKQQITNWIDLGPFENYPSGESPTFFSFTQTHINGWERTALDYGLFVVRQTEQSARAFSNICTHLGCCVSWHPDLEHYVSPCHDGHFDLLGKVISGPPPRPLDEFTTKIENGNFFIQLPSYKRSV